MALTNASDAVASNRVERWLERRACVAQAAGGGGIAGATPSCLLWAGKGFAVL